MCGCGRGGSFQAVVSKSDDSFELEELKPGDLMFWTGTYDINRDPPITHSMIYLGREKSTGRRVMVGASDGRVYRDQSRFGVSVFDFKLSRAGRAAPNGRTPDLRRLRKNPGAGRRLIACGGRRVALRMFRAVTPRLQRDSRDQRAEAKITTRCSGTVSSTTFSSRFITMRSERDPPGRLRENLSAAADRNRICRTRRHRPPGRSSCA